MVDNEGSFEMDNRNHCLTFKKPNPLFQAIDDIHYSLVKQLLSEGADIYTRNEKGKLPVEFAMEKRLRRLDSFILTKGMTSSHPIISKKYPTQC